MIQSSLKDQLFVDEATVPCGLSWIQLSTRQLDNSFVVHTLHLYKEKLPAYAQYYTGKSFYKLTPVAIDNVYKTSIAFIKDGYAFFYILGMDTLYNREDSLNFRKKAQELLREYKRVIRIHYKVGRNNYHIFYRNA